MFQPLRSVIALVSVMSLVVANMRPALAAPQLSRADYEECQARDESGLRTAVAAISAQALKTGITSVDFPALVREQWRRTGIDDVIDKRVDIAVAEVQNETSWSERLKSLADTDTSQRLATTVAEKVYRSEAVTSAIEALAAGVAGDVGKSIELASADAATPLLDCLKAYIGPRYGSAIAEGVAGDASKDLALDPNRGGGDVSAGAVLKQSSGGLAGATILVVRRQLAGLATRVGQRIVGSVLSRLVSVVAGGIGLVLIAKDIWDLRNGVLPIISSEMKAAATKEKVQEELAKTISEQINDHVQEIALATANQVIEVWQGFKRAHALVLKIAEANGDFRTFLDSVKPESLARLDEIVALTVADEGEPGVLTRLSNGSLNTAVNIMPPIGLDIARDTKSVGTALDWWSLAGERLDRVIEFDLHKRTKPSDLTRASFTKLLDLQDRAAITRLASIPPEARDALFGLQVTDLTTLAKSLSETELTTLASYLTGLPSGPREQILRSVAAEPAKMRILASASVRDAIIASADQAAAAEMMLSTTSSFVPTAFLADARMAWDGRVSPWLLWHKHPVGIALLVLLGLIIVLWLRRLFRPRPETSSVTTAEKSGPQSGPDVT